MESIDVFLLPALANPEDLSGRVCLVIDILRASTTIAFALDAGATEVIPAVEIEAARAMTVGRDRSQFILGGERGGEVIEGFDLGNSPAEYTRKTVAGRTVIFTTTNGTRAIERCQKAWRVEIASFANLSAVCQNVATEERIAIVCAGTGGRISREDSLAAGAIVDRLSQAIDPLRLNDQALLTRDAWRAAKGPSDSTAAIDKSLLADLLRESDGGRNVMRIGLESDIVLAADIDRLSIVPELNLRDGSIRIAVAASPKCE